MNFVDEKVEAYAQTHSKQPSALANEIHDWTVMNTEAPRMLSGAYQGAMLQLLVRTINAKNILEIGMFTGYSALTMAEAMSDDGRLITLDIDEERGSIARSFFSRSPHGSKISIMIGHALNTISRLDGLFDLVYIDADKENYLNYYEAVMPLLSTGGLIVADNVLWSSEVLDPKTENARSLHEFNQRVQNDMRVNNVILTIRDGLMVARKN